TFVQLGEPERRLLEVLSWVAPEPIPRFVFDAEPLTEAISDPRAALAGLVGYSLARFDASGGAVLVHRLGPEITRARPPSKPKQNRRWWMYRLVREIPRGRIPAADHSATLQLALDAVNAVAVGEPWDVRNWEVWTPLAAHAEAVSRYADEAGLTEP